jgi:hypothetical protein
VVRVDDVVADLKVNEWREFEVGNRRLVKYLLCC